MLKLEFIKVSLAENEIKVLFKLLKNRTHKISHNEIPSYEEHKDFCNSHPYRYWYLIKSEKLDIGSFYIAFDNSIGINIIDVENYDEVVSKLLIFIQESFIPLEPVKSKRGEFFTVNVPSTNQKLFEYLSKIGGKKIQTTFLI